MSIPEPNISFVTENAILLAFPDPDQKLQAQLCQLALCLRADAQTSALLREVVPGPGNLLLVLHDGAATSLLLEQAECLWQQCERQPPAPGRLIEIPVQYGGRNGPDMAAVARHTGLSEQELVQRHSAAEYRVQCLGFMAGFAYLAGMDPALAIPRKKTPAARIPAGAVAIGGNSTGIYPSATPGGWHIIGQTSIRLFDPTADSPCLLQPGDRLRFTNQDTHHA